MAVTVDHMMVAALDFGTTYSGYAFSMIHDPHKIYANHAWNSGETRLLSLKAPTCLLLNRKKQFVAFGYDAENQYGDIVLDGKEDEYYYFQRFKMTLHSNKNITTTMTLKDLSGKHMLATQVFGLSIKALVDHLMDMVERRPNPIKKNEIKWVLTVPAIWTDGAKQFMRKCAESAGILSDRLILALEPEAASIFCQYSTAEEQHRIETGTSYMVVDLGGGTADITVHEKMANGKLKELSRADGSNCGGTSVDDRFFQLLVKILGGQLMKFLRDYNLSAYLSLFREFETVKRTIDSIKTDYVNMVVPCSSLEKLCKKFLGEDFTSAIKSSPLKNDIRLCGDKIRINVDRMMKLFTPTIDDIVALMNEVLQRKKASGVTHIMLVGGFAECRLIQDRVNESFPDKTIIVPREAQLSILKGAVLFGHNPDLVKYRVMRFSYGIETSRTFIDKQDDKKYMKLVDGEKLCHKLFAKLVSKNEDVRCGKRSRESFLLVTQIKTKSFLKYIYLQMKIRVTLTKKAAKL